MKSLLGRRVGAAWVIVAGVISTGAVTLSTHAASATPRDLPPGPVYGVTVDDIANISSVVAAAEAIPYMSTTRVYLDPMESASYYKSALQQLAPHAYVMGEILDSSDMKSMTVSGEQARVSSLLSTLGSTVDIWEVGNEVNGDWTGSYSTGAQMLISTYNQVAADGDRSALTLYENSWAPNNCGDGVSELTPQQYSSQYVPPSVRDGIDYLLLSWYPTQCSGLSGSLPLATITAEIRGLHTLYPNALIGFGELGLPNPTNSSTEAAAQSIMAYYYGIAISEPYYIGGYFWWYWDEDLNLPGMPAALHNAFEAENAALGRSGPSSILRPGFATDIGVGANGSVFVVGTNPVVGGYGIYRWTGSGWAPFSGGAVKIAVDPTGNPWVVNSAHQIFHWNGRRWVAHPGFANSISVGANGSIWIVGTNPVGGGFGIYRWNGAGWAAATGGAVKIAIDPTGNPWLVNSAHAMYHWNGRGWLPYSGAATDISVGANGSVWIVGTNPALGGGGIWHRTSAGWVPVVGGAVTIAVAPDGHPWVINSAHQIFAS
jgi:hypothetical protein